MRVPLFALALIATTMQACALRAEPLPPECVDAMQKMEKLGGTLKANGSIPVDYIKAQEKDYATLKANAPKVDATQRPGFCRFYGRGAERVQQILDRDSRGMDQEIREMKDKGFLKGPM